VTKSLLSPKGGGSRFIQSFLGPTAVMDRVSVQRNLRGICVAMQTALGRRYVPADEEIPSRLCIGNIILGHAVCRPVGRMLCLFHPE
jgi:hypothetical protein